MNKTLVAGALAFGWLVLQLEKTALAAGSATLLGTAVGVTPFVGSATLQIDLHGSSVAYAGFAIDTPPGSLTRPLSAAYSLSYLQRTGNYNAGSSRITIPIFGLYTAPSYSAENNILVTVVFLDGSSESVRAQIYTPNYNDPCLSTENYRFYNYRRASDDLTFDYFLLKDYCGNRTPVIMDTDGNLRWAAPPLPAPPAGRAPLPNNQGNQGPSSGFQPYSNQLYVSNGANGLLKIDLPTGNVQQTATFGADIIQTRDHNIDIGRNSSLLLGVGTSNNGIGQTIIESDGANILNRWDMDQIVSAEVMRSGENPSDLVLPPGSDWFHQNATAFFRRAGDTDMLVVSSRENFVIAVDYDMPSGGQKKIHWILGDTSKSWYQNHPSLRKFAVSLDSRSNTQPPVGQHAVSIDSHGDLMLMNNGFGSTIQGRPDYLRDVGFSDVVKYKMDFSTVPPLFSFDYVYYNPAPYPPFHSLICGSGYTDTLGGKDSYLVDFAHNTPVTDKALNSAAAVADIRGLRSDNNVVFEMILNEGAPTPIGADPAAPCHSGFNAVPLQIAPMSFY